MDLQNSNEKQPQDLTPEDYEEALDRMKRDLALLQLKRRLRQEQQHDRDPDEQRSLWRGVASSKEDSLDLGYRHGSGEAERMHSYTRRSLACVYHCATSGSNSFHTRGSVLHSRPL